MGKRKRSRPSRRDDTGLTEGQQSSKDLPVKYALLALYYPEVLTLREYLLSKLPETSKVRRRRILWVGRENQQHKEDGSEDTELGLALDQTLVGVFEVKEKEKADAERQQLWTSFSQHRSQDDSRIGDKSILGSSVSQEEVCVFDNVLECFHSSQYVFADLAASRLLIAVSSPSSRKIRRLEEDFSIFFVKGIADT